MVCVFRGSSRPFLTRLLTRYSLGFLYFVVASGNAEFQIAFTTLPPHNPVPEIRRRTSAMTRVIRPPTGVFPPQNAGNLRATTRPQGDPSHVHGS